MVEDFRWLYECVQYFLVQESEEPELLTGKAGDKAPQLFDDFVKVGYANFGHYIDILGTDKLESWIFHDFHGTFIIFVACLLCPEIQS